MGQSATLRIGRPRPSAQQCFEHHYADVLAFAARRTSDWASAEEVAAETFAVAWRRESAIVDPPLPWLYQVARRVISNQRRGARRRLRLGARLRHERPAKARNPADIVAETSAITDALAQLSADQREVLMLIAWDGLDADQAGRVLGCSAAALRTRLWRARCELARHLETAGHVGGECTAAQLAPIPAKEMQ